MPPGGRLAFFVVVAFLTACQGSAPVAPHAPSSPTSPCIRTAFRGRPVVVHVPAGARPPLPTVLVLHGQGGTPRDIESTSGWDLVADQQHALVVYPAAVNHTWNQAPAILGSTPDDVGYLSDLVGALVADGCSDAKRIYVTGLSNGGGMAYRLACDKDLMVAAISTVSGDYMGSDKCGRTRSVPALAFHGTADTMIPISGVTDGPNVHPSVLSWAAAWATRNGCPMPSHNASTPNGPVVAWGPCPSGGDVIVYEIMGGRHEWFRSPTDATQLSWDFFAQHSL